MARQKFNKERTVMNKRFYKTLSIVLCLGLSVIFLTQVYGNIYPATAEQEAGVTALLGTEKPDILKVTVTKVELWNGSAWVTIFSGSAQLDMVGAGTFPGINELDISSGTYSKLRVTFLNSFTLKGALTYNSTNYFTTATTISDDAACVATTTQGLWTEGTIKNPDWGNLGDPVVQTYDINPFSINDSNDNVYRTLIFSIDNSLEFHETGGTYYFILNNMTVNIV